MLWQPLSLEGSDLREVRHGIQPAAAHHCQGPGSGRQEKGDGLVVVQGLVLQLGIHLFKKTTHHRISLLIGQKIPESRATEKRWLIVAGHGSGRLRFHQSSRKNTGPSLQCANEEKAFWNS